MSGTAIPPERRVFRPSLDAGNLELGVIATLDHELEELAESIKRTELRLAYERELVVLKQELREAAQRVVERAAQYRKESV